MTAIIAHRGASHAERENTVAAFRRARELGADAVELDVRSSADAVLVVHHDAYAGNPRRPIIETPRSMLPDFVPTFDEALGACDGMWVNVEIKNDPDEPDFDPTDRIADAVIRTLVSRGEPERWLISSFRLQTVDRCRVLAPAIATAWLTVEVPAGAVEMLCEHGHRGLHPEWGAVDETLVRRCHDSGLELNVWTCDDPSAIRRLADWGVDGICTNVPDIARAALGR